MGDNMERDEGEGIWLEGRRGTLSLSHNSDISLGVTNRDDVTDFSMQIVPHKPDYLIAIHDIDDRGWATGDPYLKLAWGPDDTLVMEGDLTRLDEAANQLFESLKVHIDEYLAARLAEIKREEH